MQGSYPSQTSINLCAVRRKIKRGCSEAKEPRPYTDEEMQHFRNQRDDLLQQQEEEKEVRQAARINKHTTVEIDRAIQATKETVVETVVKNTRQSEDFFQDVGGSGSSTDLMARGQVLIARAKQMEKADRAQKATEARTAKEALRKEKQAARATVREKQRAEAVQQRAVIIVQKANAGTGRKRKAEACIAETAAVDVTPPLASELLQSPIARIVPIVPIVQLTMCRLSPLRQNIERWSSKRWKK